MRIYPRRIADPSSNRSGRRGLLVVLFVILAVAVVAGSFRLDAPVAAFFAARHSARADALARFCNKWGDFPALCLYAVLGIAGAWLSGRKWVLQVALAMLLSCLLSGVLVNAMRFTAGRARPNADVPQGFYGIQTAGGLFKHKNKYHSFPSAHTACAVAFTAVVLFAEWRAGIFFVAAGLAVGCARIYSNAHHFSDVVAGAFVGIVMAWWAWRWMDRHPGFVEAMLRRRTGDLPPGG